MSKPFQNKKYYNPVLFLLKWCTLALQKEGYYYPDWNIVPGGHSHILKRPIQCTTFVTTAQDTPLRFKGCGSGNKSIPPLLRFSFHLWIFCWTTELKYYRRLFTSVLLFERKKTFFWSATQAQCVCVIPRCWWWVCGLEQQLCGCCCCSSWCLLSQLKALVSTHHHPCPAAKQ